jgi:UDP-2-acetamido-3-amino-2,3-dideoxy-glucuronate N-acetyltransferase
MTQPFLHPLSDIHSKSIGNDTKIWQFCVVLPGASIGTNCNICSHCFIENLVVIGNNVTIKNGVFLYDGIYIEDDVFIGPNVSFTNDKFPKSKLYTNNLQKTFIKKGASIGAGAIILPGLIIGENALIGAGAIVTKDLAANEIVYGQPARNKFKINPSTF